MLELKPLKIGILGGGQLGRMLLQSAANYHVETYVLESGSKPPASSLCHHFVEGDIRDFDTVYAFGKKVDALTIEIENVNVEALLKLESEGVRVVPRPSVLQIIKDKGLQKQFYVDHGIPTSDFILTENEEDAAQKIAYLPAAHKLRTGGYDGKGVSILKTEADISKAFKEPSVLEKLVDIDKEIAVMVARDHRGEIAVYPPVEMVFDPKYNLVDMLVSPADITAEQTAEVQRVARQVVDALGSEGVFAVEMFINKQGQVLVNETAPRAHNSGHQSIEGNYSSQYDMQMRVLQQLPLGSTDTIMPSLMLNLIGEEGHSGPVKYDGLGEAMQIQGVYIHLYGKHETKPGRKMGHVTILDENKNDLLAKARSLKSLLKVVSYV
ncbi:MAG: 5-(carboxyamino)imidazole ribonucleotide synthase [Bacteroidetes bacterium]|nr:5-(carboxyamino)imidazole ribonucleotide synthase [Bacteroidota bacterium]